MSARTITWIHSSGMQRRSRTEEVAMLASHRVLGAAAILLLAASPAMAKVWVVEKDGTGDFAVIQDAIRAASAEDTVLVGPGVYTDLQPDSEGMPVIVELSGGVAVWSRLGAESTILDATSTGDRRVVTAYRIDQTASFEGFTVRGGDAAMGGGIYLANSSPRIARNRVEKNLAGFGAGMVCEGRGTPLIEHNVFLENSACCGDGGGVMGTNGCSPVIRHNEFHGNFAFSGGGVGLNQAEDAIVEDNVMTGNTSIAGGGIGCVASSGLITRNVVTGNEAERGGGISAWWSDGVTFSHNLVAHNVATVDAGGGYQISGGSPEIRNETISHNQSIQGAGIFIGSGASVLLVNSIVTFGLEGEGIFAADDQSAPLVLCSDVYGNMLGDYGGSIGNVTGHDGNVSIDPLFCDGDDGDYHLSVRSPLRVRSASGGCGAIGAVEGRCNPTPVGGDVRGGGRVSAAPSVGVPFPNPMGSVLRIPVGLQDGAEGLVASIHDASGRRVRELRVAPGESGFVWDGRDAKGGLVPNGIYFVKGAGVAAGAHVIVTR